MIPPLRFFPSPRTALLQHAIIVVAALGAAFLLWSLLHGAREIDSAAWIWAIAKIAGGLGCAALAAYARRTARRIVEARAHDEPQLVIDTFGVMIRDDFAWRTHRFAWSKITGIDVVPDDKGVSVIVRGKLGTFGSMIDILTDSDEPAEAIAARIEPFLRRHTLH